MSPLQLQALLSSGLVIIPGGLLIQFIFCLAMANVMMAEFWESRNQRQNFKHQNSQNLWQCSAHSEHVTVWCDGSSTQDTVVPCSSVVYIFVICCGNMCCNTTEYVINTNNSMRPFQLLHVSPHHPKSLGWFQFCFFYKKLICCSF